MDGSVKESKKKKKYPKVNDVPGVELPKDEANEGTKWKENAQKMKALIGNEAAKKANVPKGVAKTADKSTVKVPSPLPRPPHFSPLRPPDLSPLAHRPQMGLTHPIPTLNPHPLPSFPLPSFSHPSIHHSRLLSPGKFEEFLYAVQEKGRFEYQSLELKPPSIPKPRKKRVEKKMNGEPTTPGSAATPANSASAGASTSGTQQKEAAGVIFLIAFYFIESNLFFVRPQFNRNDRQTIRLEMTQREESYQRMQNHRPLQLPLHLLLPHLLPSPLKRESASIDVSTTPW